MGDTEIGGVDVSAYYMLCVIEAVILCATVIAGGFRVDS